MKQYFDIIISMKSRWIIEAENKEEALWKFNTFNVGAHQSLHKKTIKRIAKGKPIGKLTWSKK